MSHRESPALFCQFQSPSNLSYRNCEPLRLVERRIRGALGGGMEVEIGSVAAASLLEELGHHGGPAGLVACADPAAVVAMEIFEERHVVAPVRVGLEQLVVAEHRAAATFTSF